MFEPLAKLLGERGDELKDILSDIRSHLGRIVSNTETTLAETQYADYSTSGNIAKEERTELEFHSSDGYLWKVFGSSIYAGLSVGTRVFVYVNAVAGHNLVDVIDFKESVLEPFHFAGVSTTKYWVPPRSRLIFVFENSGAEATDIAARIQCERFVLGSEQPAPTRSFEQVDKDHHPSQLPHAPGQRVGEPIG